MISIGRKTQGCGRTRGFDGEMGDLFIVFPSDGFQFPWRVRDAPLDHIELIDRLFDERLAVENERDGIAIRQRHDLDRLSLLAGPIPMGREREDWPIGDPLRLVDRERRFWEATQVHAAEEARGG